MKFTEAAQHAKKMGQVFRAFAKLEEMCLTAARAEGACAELTRARDELSDEVKVLTARAAKLRAEKKELKDANLTERVKTSAEVKALVDAGNLQLSEQKREHAEVERKMNEDFQLKRGKFEETLNWLKNTIEAEEKRLQVATEAARVAREKIERLG